MIENKKSTKVGANVFVNEACPNVDYKYGLYESVEAAYATLGEDGMDVIAVGLTVGILTEDGVVEYWFKKGTTLADLVPKNANGNLEQIVNDNTEALNELKDEIQNLKTATEHIESVLPSDDADGNGIPDGIDKLNRLEEATEPMTEDDIADMWNSVFGTPNTTEGENS